MGKDIRAEHRPLAGDLLGTVRGSLTRRGLWVSSLLNNSLGEFSEFLRIFLKYHFWRIKYICIHNKKILDHYKDFNFRWCNPPTYGDYETFKIFVLHFSFNIALYRCIHSKYPPLEILEVLL